MSAKDRLTAAVGDTKLRTKAYAALRERDLLLPGLRIVLGDATEYRRRDCHSWEILGGSCDLYDPAIAAVCSDPGSRGAVLGALRLASKDLEACVYPPSHRRAKELPESERRDSIYGWTCVAIIDEDERRFVANNELDSLCTALLAAVTP